jgi:hypothetical protein
MIEGRWAMPFLSCTVIFALQLRKSTGDLSQGSQMVLDTIINALTWLSSSGQPQLAC